MSTEYWQQNLDQKNFTNCRLTYYEIYQEQITSVCGRSSTLCGQLNVFKHTIRGAGGGGGGAEVALFTRTALENMRAIDINLHRGLYF